MRIILTHHAISRLLERGIDVSKAKDTVRNPSWKKEQGNGSIAVRREFEGETIEVIYVENRNSLVIKTAYYAG